MRKLAMCLNGQSYFNMKLWLHAQWYCQEAMKKHKFKRELELFPWIGEQQSIEILSQLFSNLITYVRAVGKLLNQHFNVTLFSNPGENFLILVESRGKICPVIFFFLGPSSLDWRIKIYWHVGPTIFQQPWHKLENVHNHISMNGCSPIQGKDYYSCCKLTKIIVCLYHPSVILNHLSIIPNT